MNKFISSAEIGGNRYQVGALSPRKQFHIARRILPLLTKMGVSLSDLKNPSESLIENMAIDSMFTKLAEMREEDVDYVINTCLAVCHREQNGHWAPVLVGPGEGTLMFPDISMQDMMSLVVDVIKANISSFFPTAPSGSQTETGSGQLSTQPVAVKTGS